MKQGMVFNEIRHLTAYGVTLLLVTVFLCAFPADLQALTPEEEILQKIGVDEKLDAVVPLDLVFTDQVFECNDTDDALGLFG
jgi:hypothetical protein